MTSSDQVEAAVAAPVSHARSVDDACAPVRLAEILDRAEAAHLLAILIERRGQELTLDASGVCRIGGQCLQILMSTAATWSSDAVAFAVADASQEFIAGVELFGVDPQRLSPRDKMNGIAS